MEAQEPAKPQDLLEFTWVERPPPRAPHEARAAGPRLPLVPLALAALALLAVQLAVSPEPVVDAPLDAVAEALPPRPNFLVIISDDQRYDTMDHMPLTKAHVFDEGITFSRGYVTTPLCCPSRSSILTGLYAHHHGVILNKELLNEETFVEVLNESGYYTGLVGKYLNSWPGNPRPEFDRWVAFDGGVSRYHNPNLNVDGNWTVGQGYITHVLLDHALEFLAQAANRTDPFLLIFAPNAPHPPADPAPGDEALYEGLAEHRPPSYNEASLKDKPPWLRGLPALAGDEATSLDDLRLRQLQSLNALDQAVDALLSTLDAQGRLDDTFVLYISDNGFFWGEHRLTGKNRVYEEATRVPFAVRYPRALPAARVEDHLVANIDIAPTLYDIAGLPVPAGLDGRSLVPIFSGNATGWREELLLEGWLEQRPTFKAVHTDRFVYVANADGFEELYDLEEDPFQLWSRANDPAYAHVMADLRQRLTMLRDAQADLRLPH